MKSRVTGLGYLYSFDVSSGLNLFHTESVENTPTDNTTESELTRVAGDASVSLFLKEKIYD